MCSRRSTTLGARGARAHRRRRSSRVTGSVGKTGTKEALRLALSRDGETHASAASYNNHWGVPLSLARMPAERALRRVRDRHEPCRRDRAADRLVRPHVAIVTTVAPVHLEFFARSRRSPTPRPRSSTGSSRAAPRCINRDNPQFDALAQRGEDGGASRIVSFGEHAEADARLIERCAASRTARRVQAQRPRHRRHLQARRAGPPCRAELARRAGAPLACRRRSRARPRWRSANLQPPTGARRAHHARDAAAARRC